MIRRCDTSRIGAGVRREPPTARRRLTKREARKYVFGVLSLGEVTSIIDAQVCCSANPQFASISDRDRRLIVSVAEEIEQEMFTKAGKNVMAFIAPIKTQKVAGNEP